MSDRQQPGIASVAFASAILLALLTFTVKAQGEALMESFDDPTLPGWERTPNAEVVEGVLRIDRDGYASHPGDWNDINLTVRASLEGEGALVVSYRVSDAGEYAVNIGRDQITLHKAGEAMAQESIEPIPPGEWFSVELFALGDHHEMLLNGKPALVTSDPDPLPPGGVTLSVVGEALGQFDDLVVRTLGEAPPPQEPEPVETKPSEEAAPQEPAPGDPAEPTTLQWIYTGGPSGGLGYDIRMDPRDPDVMYVTDAFAGAFKSTDGGANWVPINNGITTRIGPAGDGIPVFSLTIDPNDPDTLWAGTQVGAGVFRSDDAGQNWRAMNTGIQEESLAVRGFAVQPGNSDVVYLAGEVASWEWNGAQLMGLNFDLTMGVVYKSTDGGQNWTRLWYGDHLGRYIWIHPDDPDRLYVSTGIFDREAANSDPEARTPGGVGILRTTDGGQTWEELGTDHGMRAEELYFSSLAMHPDDPDVLFAAAGSDAHQWALDHLTGAVYRSEDGGDSWQRVLDLPNATAVEICEGDPQVMYAASVALFYRSDDGGETWQEPASNAAAGIDFWGPESTIAGFPIDMQCDPRDAMRIYVNNYGGGNFLSQDGGQTWMNASKGYTGAIMDQVVVAPGYPALVYGTARSGVFKSTDGGETWQGMSRGVARALEAQAVAVDPEDPAHVIAVIGDAGPVPKISDDSGQTWHEADPNLNGTEASQWAGMHKMAFSPLQSGAVIGVQGESKCVETDNCLEGFGVIYSSDGGETWNHSDLTSGMATEVAFAPDGSAYAALYPGDLYHSSDGGQTWTLISQGAAEGMTLQDPDALPGFPALAALAVDSNDSSKLYAGFSRGGVMISEDGGLSWEPSSSGMVPETAVFDLVADATRPGTIYAASRDSGFYISQDGGSSWRAMNEGLFNRAALSLALASDGSVLYLATEGGGVFRLDLSGRPPIPLEGVSTDGESFSPVDEDGGEMLESRPGDEAGFEMTVVLIGIGLAVLVGVIVVVMLLRRRAEN